MMSDDFLSRFRDEPRREFAEDLKRRLREIEVAEGEPAAGRRGRAVPVLAGAAIAATVALAFTLPPVRAAARNFLDLFRVKRFAAVPVDPDRLAPAGRPRSEVARVRAGRGDRAGASPSRSTGPRPLPPRPVLASGSRPSSRAARRWPRSRSATRALSG